MPARWLDRIACRTKERYPSRRAALRVLRRFIDAVDLSGKRRPAVEVYRCKCCEGGWHLGGVVGQLRCGVRTM